MMHGMGGLGFGLGGIFWLLLLGAVIWGVIAFVNNYNNKDQAQLANNGGSAADILKKRFGRRPLRYKNPGTELFVYCRLTRNISYQLVC